MRIDAHQHFWLYDPAEYGWIDAAMRAIRRDFQPADLLAEMRAAGITGSVCVQARQSLAETRWLLDLADRHDFIKGVVGWVALADPACEIPDHPKLKGVRHVVQSERDGFLLRENFNRGVDRLRERGLAYDLLIVERQLPDALQFVDRHPDQVFVIDHIAKPRIRDDALTPWRENIRELARRANVWCKLSGMVTEADYGGWTEAQLRPYVDVVLDAFGPRRLMFGSDWPVCLVAVGYARWAGIVDALSANERDHIMGRTAAGVYQL
ncbi:MAG: amidohydrolase family protein [Lentisphaerae bacterium]|nr:amidohydrolase family protein [Lentisphaerota bacterium]